MYTKIKKKALPAIVIVIALAVSFVIVNTKPEVKKHVHRKKPITVESMVVKPQVWSSTIRTQGTVEARTMSTLTSRISGEVMWVSNEFRSGGFFEKGDVLLKVDPVDYQLAIKSAEAQLAEARFEYQEEQAQSAQARLNWKRLGRTEKPTDLVLRKPQLAKAKAVVDSAKAVLQRAQLDLKRTVIKAPYASRILEQYVDVGQFVAANKDLVKLFAIDQVEVRLPLSEKQREQLSLPSVYRGESLGDSDNTLPIAVKAAMGGKIHRWPALFSRVEGAINRDTRQQYIVAGIANPFQKTVEGRPPLEVGQFVEAELRGRKNNGVFIIPSSSLNGEGELMIIDEDNKLQRRSVEMLAEEGTNTVITAGLSAGERICISYIPFSANGTKVRLVGETPQHVKGQGKGSPRSDKAGNAS